MQLRAFTATPLAVTAIAASLLFAAAAAAEQVPNADYAPIGPRHEWRVRYALPFALDMPRMLAQGVDGPFTHQGKMRYAFDWAMPEGTEILAAREGTVADVRDGWTEGGFDPRFIGKDNAVIVLHPDGTFASYMHLRKGIPVHKGQAVRQRERIGWSGHTGYSSAPHLHFAVHERVTAQTIMTIPIRFGVGHPEGFVPEPGKFYGNRPITNAELRVLGPEPVGGELPLHLARGAARQLEVLLIATGAEPIDVTRWEHTTYFAPVGRQGPLTAASG
ncbi:MAG TPA: M23 family metallopeptidase [Myxococcota bacterium]|nr:M23 family metallopeptidase [Myxococcota bacterium]